MTDLAQRTAEARDDATKGLRFYLTTETSRDRLDKLVALERAEAKLEDATSAVFYESRVKMIHAAIDAILGPDTGES